MTTEIRLRELFEINNHIVIECDKMMQYLQIIKEKSENAIKFLNSLNTANFLRRYSLTYEYLNKFYIKLLDQNCLFELFFLELDEPTADLLSAHTSVKDLLSEPTKLDSRNRDFSESLLNNSMGLVQQHSDVNTSNERSFNNSTCLVQQHSEINTSNERFDGVSSKISGITRTRDTKPKYSAQKEKMNVEATEFYPRTNSTNTSISSRDVVLESSVSSKSDINTADKSKVVELSEKNVAQHNLQPSNKSISINSKQKAIGNTSRKTNKTTSDSFSVSSLTSELQVPEKYNHKEKKCVSENQDDVIDVKIKDVIKNLNDKIRANELKSSVPIPDLRPSVVVRRDTASSTSSNAPQMNGSPTKNTKSVNKKSTNQTHSRKENDIFHNNIEFKRGPIPKEGDLCCVSAVESVSSFYMHVIRDDNTLIDSLSTQIAEICNSLKSFYTKKEARKYISHLCVCYINAHTAWCRVEITNWLMENEQMIEVRLIDYGLVCRVPLRNIREANQYIFQLPIMSDRCELAWVKPLNNRKDWSRESIEYFNKLISDGDRLFTISYVEEDMDHLIVDLQTNKIDSIAGLMIANGKAAADDESDDSKKWNNEFMRKQIVKSQGFSEQELNQREEDRLESLMFEFDEEDDEEHANPNVAVSHYNPIDEKEICRIFLKRGHCFKGNNCTFSHNPLNPDGWTTDREAVFYDAFNQLQLPQPGDEVTVKVVNIVDLRSFYVVVKNLTECTNLIGLAVNNIRTLVKLMNDPEEINAFKRLTVIPALGEIILVKFEGNWQRARVVDLEEFAHKVEIEVLLVDFGITRRFNMKHCRKIEEKHLNLPFQVILCTLCNVSMKEELTEEEADMGNDYLEINVDKKKLKARVMYTSQFLSVHLFTENGQDIGEELIKAGIVNRCTESYTSIAEHGLLVD